jgi:hypothetical protein
MSEIELNNTANLLSHVSLITKKYDDLAEYTGENYNIFNVLKIYNNELSHSAIIGDLLNAKGKHGQKDIFLRLFLEELSEFEEESVQEKVLKSFNNLNSEVLIEKHIGKVNLEIGEGGRIDILITDGNNNIIIENKIWAGDQHQQLVRYNNFDKNAPIIYLTLDNKDASDSSKDYLLLGKEFVCMSYKENICNWLKRCIKEMANKPIIRESLNQYLVLVKQLTNQATNDKMKEEIIDLIIKDKSNFGSLNSLVNIQSDLLTYYLKNVFLPFLKELVIKHNITLEIEEDNFVNLRQKWGGFAFTNEKLDKLKDFNITFSFNQAGVGIYNNLIFGFCSKTGNSDLDIRIQNAFKNEFGNFKSSHWLCFADYKQYQNWTNLNTLQEIYFSDFKIDFEDKLAKMLKIVQDYV